MFKLAVGQEVPIPVLKMFGELLYTIVLPFGLATLVQRRAPTFIKKHDSLWREISVLAFGVLIAGIVADTTAGSTVVLGWDEVGILVVMLAYLGGLTWLAYGMAWWRTPAEKATIALSMVYMNNTLALFIGNRYFNAEGVVPRLVIILIIVNLLLPPFRWIAKRAAYPEEARHDKPHLQPRE